MESELNKVLTTLTAQIESTKAEYNAMMELRALVQAEFEIMYNQQLELSADIKKQLVTMNEVRQAIEKERGDLQNYRTKIDIPQKVKARSKTPPKKPKVYIPSFTIGGLGAKR
jgi:flagellar biosynthesis chaperone FliJ